MIATRWLYFGMQTKTGVIHSAVQLIKSTVIIGGLYM